MYNRFFIGLIFLWSAACLGEETIKIGCSTPIVMSGADSTSLGSGVFILDGIKLYFTKINALGGIQGRKIELTILDDHYDPILSGQNVIKLIDDYKVLSLIANNGTPQLSVTLPIINKERVLLYAAVTGTSQLRRTPPDRYVINFSAGTLISQTEAMRGLMSIGIKPEEMAFISQNDAAGTGSYRDYLMALKNNGFEKGEELPHGTYNVESQDVESAFGAILRTARIKNYKIKVIHAAATGVTSAKIIHLTQSLFPDAMINFSSYTLRWMQFKEILDFINEKKMKIIMISPVPMLSMDLPAIHEYREDFKKYAPNQSEHFYSFEGYLTAKLFVIALQQAAEKNILTREGIIDSFESLKDVDIGLGVKISLSKENHNALNKVWPSILKDSQFVPLEWDELKSTSP